MALIITYHAIEPGPAPLCIDPETFRAHLDCLAECGARVLTVSELAGELAQGGPDGPTVALTFDDGFESVVTEAAPLMLERDMRGTVFCISGYLGAGNDWPSQPARTPHRLLASATELRNLSRSGFEIGSHGDEHAVLRAAPEQVLRREIVESRRALEGVLGVRVSSFAYPYGVLPDERGRALVERCYTAACGSALRIAGSGATRFDLPRVDAHYLLRPRLLRAALTGSLGPYLGLRRAGARARRLVRRDYDG